MLILDPVLEAYLNLTVFSQIAVVIGTRLLRQDLCPVAERGKGSETRTGSVIETEIMTEIVIGTETGTGTGTDPLTKLHVAPRDGEGVPLPHLHPTKGAVGELRNGNTILVFLGTLH